MFARGALGFKPFIWGDGRTKPRGERAELDPAPAGSVLRPRTAGPGASGRGGQALAPRWVEAAAAPLGCWRPDGGWRGPGSAEPFIDPSLGPSSGLTGCPSISHS